MRIEDTLLFFIYAETPLHPGAGTGIGAIDNPVQREVITSLPLIPASMVKGSLRSEFHLWAEEPDTKEEKKERKKKVCAVFGPTANELASAEESTEGKKKSGLYASAVAFTDARLLAFPVRVPGGLFIWTVCPFTLQRLKRDLALLPENIRPSLPELPELKDQSPLVSSEKLLGANADLAIEDILLKGAQQNGQVNKIAEWLAKILFEEQGESYWNELLKNRLALIPDNVFIDLTCRCTEIVTRTKLKEGEKTVDEDIGGLWTEEYIPAETIFYSLALFTKPSAQAGSELKDAAGAREFLQNNCPSRFQLGGDETVGRGFVRLRMHQKASTPGTKEIEEAAHAAS